ncbi:OLC1v1000032C1 [Oldenlandia corymbosa var. corymbosa]|uniref:non-specific serine/threonine protein kinase n=1 Tax=Oldenlandia corymbosa var. corymbosa TaxID=529605 RepID=A0AAV1D2F3_OLDCO|nr:OLC1v1000032C1 [Oldenlandia corymbosa var. corymbosa]
MTSPGRGGRWRNLSSPGSTGTGPGTPDLRRGHFSPSPSPYYSSSPSPYKSNSDKNPVKIAVRSVAGAFIACFTPPEKVPAGSVKSYDERSDCSSQSGSTERRRRGTYSTSNNGREPRNQKFSIEEIYKATKNFSPSLKIGQGGFGTVYKGKLDDGKLVAIKRAKRGVIDKNSGAEFRSEVRTLEKVGHLNLVKFYGYLELEEERIIVVEYVPNGTLREHLDCMHGRVLEFASRLDIAIDVAHAVTYLHMYIDHPIIHRDIKSSNILLTENFRAKVADFGFARLAADSESGATHVSTQVKGTAGYLDPEYLKSFQLTEKSDVYSFGVLLVELVTGRRPIEPKREMKERITVRWAMKKFMEGDAILTLDPRLERCGAKNLAIEKMYELALVCLAPTRRNRPSMRKCAEVLWSIRKDYREQLGSDISSDDSQARFSMAEE